MSEYDELDQYIRDFYQDYRTEWRRSLDKEKKKEIGEINRKIGSQSHAYGGRGQHDIHEQDKKIIEEKYQENLKNEKKLVEKQMAEIFFTNKAEDKSKDKHQKAVEDLGLICTHRANVAYNLFI